MTFNIGYKGRWCLIGLDMLQFIFVEVLSSFRSILSTSFLTLIYIISDNYIMYDDIIDKNRMIFIKHLENDIGRRYIIKRYLTVVIMMGWQASIAYPST